MTKNIVAFRDIANAPKYIKQITPFRFMQTTSSVWKVLLQEMFVLGRMVVRKPDCILQLRYFRFWQNEENCSIQRRSSVKCTVHNATNAMTRKFRGIYCRAGSNSADAVDVLKRLPVQIQENALVICLSSQSSQENIGMLI